MFYIYEMKCPRWDPLCYKEIFADYISFNQTSVNLEIFTKQYRMWFYVIIRIRPVVVKKSVTITTEVVCSNAAHGEMYWIQHYVIKFVSDLWQVGGLLRVLRLTHTTLLRLLANQYFLLPHEAVVYLSVLYLWNEVSSMGPTLLQGDLCRLHLVQPNFR
jgi:hypothetical protein